MTETILSVQELADIARARAAFSSFLAIHLNVLPDEKFVKQMRNKDVVSMLKVLPQDEAVNEDIASGATLMESYLEATQSDKPAQLAEKLGVDRTRIYRGLSPTYGPPPPYEMVWSQKWRELDLLIELTKIYRENHLAPSSKVIDRLDYMGMELEFIHALAARETTAWDEGKAEAAGALFEAQKAFFAEHMQQWIPDFVEKALESAQTEFYHGHLLMVRGFILEQAEIFSTVSSIPAES
jgi:TorA maturation chaperone TorD